MRAHRRARRLGLLGGDGADDGFVFGLDALEILAAGLAGDVGGLDVAARAISMWR
jgi:hypothetical protein